ncbi:MAG: phosphate signaling complex protein PhoU [Kiritimatiellia bacterium]
MAIIFLREIEILQERILRQSIEVEDRLQKSLQAVANRDVELAAKVIAGDTEIDQREVAIEEECLKLLALHQPVASDLRFLIATLKLNNDLERIGDLAVNIADRARLLATAPQPSIRLPIDRMSVLAIGMLRKVFRAFMDHNAGLAAEVVASDDELDELNRQMITTVVVCLRSGEPAPDALLLLLGVSRELERVGDHASNIAEDLIYMFEGEIVRHHKAELARTTCTTPIRTVTHETSGRESASSTRGSR